MTVQGDTLQAPGNGQTDHGWAWLVLAGSFFCFCCIGIVMMSFSVLYVEFVDVFDKDLATIGWIGAVQIGCMQVLGFVTSALIKLFGCRVVSITGSLLTTFGYLISSIIPANVLYLYFSCGVISGIGSGMIFLPAAVVVQQYFDRFRSVASGIAISGISIGALVAGPITQLLLDHYGWRGTLLLIGGIMLHVSVAGSLYRPFPKTCQSTTKVGGTNTVVQGKNIGKTLLKDLMDFSLFRNPMFFLYWFATFLLNVAMMAQFQHVPNRAVKQGADIHQAVFFPTVYGVSSMISSVVFGCVGNLKCTDRLILYGVAIFSGGFIIVMSVFATDFISMMILYSLYSITVGMFCSVQYPVLYDLLGSELIARSQALLSVSFGLGALLGIPFAGFLFDITGSYDYTFYITGAIQMVGGLLIFGILPLRRRVHMDLKQRHLEVPVSPNTANNSAL